MKYTIETLLNTASRIKYIFFWGHQPTRDGSISSSCFSQWWKSEFEENGFVYKTAEHYMMMKKAALFGDHDIETKMQTSDSPAELKKLGRMVKNFDPNVWDAHKFEIVKRANFLKFSQNEPLKTFLLSTKDRVIVEASPVDAIWGIGMAMDHRDVNDPSKWKGENLLGFALMEVRDELKK